MDQFDAFQYFLTNLFLHNVVLVGLAVLLGVVLGRLMFGGRKVALEQLQASIREHQERARAAEQELERLQEQHGELRARVEAGDTSFSPQQERELKALRAQKSVLQERVQGMAERLEETVSRQGVLEGEKEGLEAELAALREGASGDGAQAELAKMLGTMQALEKRVTETEDQAREESRGELEALSAEKKRLSEALAAALREVEELKEAATKAGPSNGLPAHRGSRADIQNLEQRVAEAHKEREQVEKASAVLRKEMRGLRNKVKEIEQQERRETKLEEVLKETEERLARSQAAEAKESRVRASLEKIVEELEWQVADAAAERERLRDVVDAGPGAEGRMDDLTRIKGVGAVLQKKLRAVGVMSLRQIADWTDEELAELSRKLQLGNRAERDDWRGQARTLCDGD